MKEKLIKCNHCESILLQRNYDDEGHSTLTIMNSQVKRIKQTLTEIQPEYSDFYTASQTHLTCSCNRCNESMTYKYTSIID